MTKYKVVLVPFPFDDLSSTKIRPAVCLTDPIGPYRHVVLAFITSRASQPMLATDLLLAVDDDGFDATGLRVASVVKLHRIITMTTPMILRELGDLSEIQQDAVRRKVATLFELA